MGKDKKKENKRHYFFVMSSFTSCLIYSEKFKHLNETEKYSIKLNKS